MSTITGETFDLWKTGWSTFVQIPRSQKGEAVELLGAVMYADTGETRALHPSCSRFISMELGWVVTMSVCALVHSRVRTLSPSLLMEEALCGCVVTLKAYSWRSLVCG